MPTETVEPQKNQSRIPEMLVSWSAPARAFEKRPKLWFFGLAVLAIGTLVLLTIFNEFMFGLLLFSFGALLFVQSAVKPPVTTYSIYSSGVQLNENKIYTWEDLESFFIDAEKGNLYLKTVLSFPSELSLLIDKNKKEEIEETLLIFLPYLEIKKTDYLSVFDGFVSRFSEKLPKNFTSRFVKDPKAEMIMEPKDLQQDLQKRVKKFKIPSFKRKNKTDKK